MEAVWELSAKLSHKILLPLHFCHSTKGPKIPFISNLKKPTCAFKRNVLELAILQ